MDDLLLITIISFSLLSGSNFVILQINTKITKFSKKPDKFYKSSDLKEEILTAIEFNSYLALLD